MIFYGLLNGAALLAETVWLFLVRPLIVLSGYEKVVLGKSKLE
jgi:hypothetical protein